MYALRALMISGALAVAAGGDELELTRVALFSSGVGYFQADGVVEGDATAELHFRTGQINDILKSLVLQDFDGGIIDVVEYPSRDPIEKTLRSFGVDITDKPTLGQLLDRLRGVEVEIAAPASVTGLILGVEKHQVIAGEQTVVVERLALLTPDGLRSFRLDEIGGIRIADPSVEGELTKALQTLATSHDADKKTVTLSFQGQGQRRVRAAYMLEAPIWKTSYRLVLSEKGKPYLQGWAIVENTTEEDWHDVRLSLVSGRPISFIMDLYEPLYVPRPTERLELYASLRPPGYEGAMEEAEEDRYGGAPRSVLGEAVAYDAAAGEPGQVESLMSRMRGKAYARQAAPSPSLADLGTTGVASVASALEAGELFTYDIQTPVSLKRQHSAMLPVVTTEVEAEKLSVYNPATHAKHPLNGVQLTNTTGLQLMQGPVTVFDGDTYAGDAKLPDLTPDEKRLVAYALDLATEVEMISHPKPEEIVSLRIAKGTLWHKRKYLDSRTYNIKNKDDKARTLIIEQPYDAEWTLVEPKEPFERARDMYRFKTEVAANKTGSLDVLLERTADQFVALMSISLDDIRFYLKQRVISSDVRQALEYIIARRVEFDDVVRRRGEAERQITTIEQEQDRIRKNMGAIPRDSDIFRRYLSKFDEQETQMEKLRDLVTGLRQDEETKRAALEKYLLNLTVE